MEVKNTNERMRLPWRFKERETSEKSSLGVKKSFSMLFRGQSTLVEGEVPSYIKNYLQQKFSSKIVFDAFV